MDEESPAASSEVDESRAGSARLLATRGRKIAAIVGGAFLATVGGVIATRAIAVGESTTKSVLGDGPSAPLIVRVLPRGSLSDTTLIPPYFVVPRTQVSGPAALAAPVRRALIADGTEWSTWAREHGAVDGSSQIVLLELRASTDEPVTVTGIDVAVLARNAPMKGWFVANPTGCGLAPVRLATVDLDAPKPEVGYYKDDESPKTDHLVLSVTRTNQEVIQLIADTKQALVDWRAEVQYSGSDGPGSVVVDDGGTPFRVSSEVGSEGYTFEFASKKIRRRPDWDNGIHTC